MSKLIVILNALSKLVDFIVSIHRKNKEEKLQNDYKDINEDLKDYATGDNSDGNTGMYTPDGKPPTLEHLRASAKTKR